MKAGAGKIVFAGGGTGGHIYPALATIEALQQKGDFQILFVGGYQGMENKIIPRQGIPFRKITVSGFQRYFTPRNFLFPFKLTAALWQSWRLLRSFKPAVVVGTGGYVSGPVVYLAAKMGIPTLIEEQDSYPGITTRILAKYATVICLAHQAAAAFLKKAKGEILVTGTPVRKSLKFVEQEQAKVHWGFDPGKPVLFVFGGSQGARSLNRAVARLAEEWTDKYEVQILWQTGTANFDEVGELPAVRNPLVKVVPYIEEMALAFSAADLIISRAGAITIAELSLAMKPCIFVPYPWAAANHQEHNANLIRDAGAALVVKDDENLVDGLNAAVEVLLPEPQRARQMGERWRKFQHPDAAEKIAEKIMHLAAQQNSGAGVI